VTGRRVPTPTRVCNAVAIQRGTERPNDVVIITGHIDSRVTDVMDFTSDVARRQRRRLRHGRGAGGGAGAVVAQVPRHDRLRRAVGRGAGALGGKILADYAKAQGWNVVANLNNDIIGNSCGSDGVCDDKAGARLLRRAALAGPRGARRRAAQPRRRE
jgi:hypothetical protein